VWLYHAHPEVFNLTCDHCAKYLPPTKGTGARDKARRLIPLPRTAADPTPCGTCPKVPTDAPERTRAHAIELSPKNHRAFLHYTECAAVGWQVPEANDWLVRRNAGIILRTINAWRDGREREMAAMFGIALARLATPETGPR
jgi:hypothetical protein